MISVYWLTGLSGAGKTTIGHALYEQLKKEKKDVVFLDGDELREILGDCYGYSAEERQKCAMFYARLCKLLADQGLTVVCCTISMFDCVREWNRLNIAGYLEIYLRVSMEHLCQRDQKKLYSGIQSKNTTQVVGMDLPAEEPKNPDIVLDSNGQITTEECVQIILNRRDLF